MSVYRPAEQSNLEEGKGKLTGPGSRHKSLKVRNFRVWMAEHYVKLGDGAGSGWSLGTIDISLWRVLQMEEGQSRAP